MHDPIKEFADALEAAGYSLPRGKTIVADDGWHRLLFLDEKNSSGRYRLAVVSPDFAIGGFGSDKDSAGFHKWHSKTEGEALSKEDRAALRKMSEDAKQQRSQDLIQQQERVSARLAKVVSRLPKAVEHPYLKNKSVKAHGLLIRKKGAELVVPMYATDGRVWNIQRITGRGWKGFFKGARVNGTCFPLGAYDGGVLVICEGFATGASVHEVTGLPVRVAFNTANLKHLAQELKKKYPDAQLVFCADNDQWTFKPNKKPDSLKSEDVKASDPCWAAWRDEGLLWNPGVQRAQEAAAMVGGAVVIWPEFDKIDDKPTDFNDLRLLSGDESVNNRISSVLVERAGAQGDVADAPPSAWEGMAEGDTYSGNHEQPRHSQPTADRVWPFKILGHNDGQYFFFPRNSGQIFTASAQSLGSIVNLFRLANLDFWNDYFNVDGKKSTRKVAELAANALVQEAHDVGIFKPSNIRGAGAWIDKGRAVIHCGDHLLVDGEKIYPHRFQSRYVYPLRSADFPSADSSMDSQEANQLREICGMISWESKLSGDLLAGWIVIAPVCGALEWRPHIWVEGESESGKTTVIDRIIRPLLDGVSLRFDGGTTEAAIRQEMGIDALPVIYDEAEPENVKDRMIMDGLLLLARRASSGGRIVKGGTGGHAESFTMRSCFCFAGINPAIKQRADESRISRLVIKRAVFEGADQFFKELKAKIRSTLTRDFSHRLLARTIENLPTLIANCETFTDAAADVLTSRRAADQIGPMLAGLYLLTSTKRVDFDKAVEFIKRHDWTMHTAISEQSDPERLITYISTYMVRYNNKEMTIGELISQAHSELFYTGNEGPNNAPSNFLRSYGIWVRDDGVLFANKSPNLERLLAATAWVSWSRPLKDLPGAAHEMPLKFATGLHSRSVRVPLEAFGIDAIYTPPPSNEEDIPWPE